jgi:3-hydroxymyristoyl/3-hydroxydecanoyl-(acyl carrier protein) dehydratase
MTLAGRFTIGPDHPCLPGHFPGRPVVPGVVLLDEVLAAILAVRPGYRAAGLPSVKFTRPVLPGKEVEISCDTRTDRVAFVCVAEGAEVARGAVVLEAVR